MVLPEADAFRTGYIVGKSSKLTRCFKFIKTWAKDLKFKPSSLTELSLQKPDNILQTESSKILKELKR